MSLRLAIITDETVNELSLAIRDGNKDKIRSMLKDASMLPIVMRMSKSGITLPDHVDLLGILTKQPKHLYKINLINIAFGMGNAEMCKLLLEQYENYGIQFSRQANTGAAFALSQIRNEFPKGPGVDPIQDAQKVVQFESPDVAKQFEAVMAFRIALTRRLGFPLQSDYEAQFEKEKARLMLDKKPCEVKEEKIEKKIEEKKEEVKIDEEANAREEKARRKEIEERQAKLEAEAKAEISRKAQRRLDQETRARQDEILRVIRAREELDKEERLSLESLTSQGAGCLQRIITSEFASELESIPKEISKVRERKLILQTTRDAKINALTYLLSLLSPDSMDELKRFTQAMASAQETFQGADQKTYYPSLAMSAKWNSVSGTAKIVQAIVSKIETVEVSLRASSEEYVELAQQRTTTFARSRQTMVGQLAHLQQLAAEKSPEQRLEELEKLMDDGMEKPKPLAKAHLFSPTMPLPHQTDHTVAPPGLRKDD